MKSENNIDFNNISLILNTLKNTQKEDKKEDSLLMKNYKNTNYIKELLPLIVEDNENIYKIINYVLLCKYFYFFWIKF